MTDELWPMAVAVFCTWCLMPLVMRTFATAGDEIASPQHVHAHPISRLGGGIVFVAYASGIALTVSLRLTASRPILMLLACALPVFLVGVWEDISRRVSPKQRLAAAVVSAILASVFADGVVARLDILHIDGWLTNPVFAELLTCFMVAGACNALNLIDGANGLAGGTALLMFAGLAGAAWHVGDHQVFVQAVAVAGALAGFLYWNFPRARVFLGDGGAYFIGFMYAELSIQIVARNEHVSAWFVVMLAAYPIVETVYSIYRRKMLLRTPSTEPDAFHLHSLIYHRVTLPAEKQRADTNICRANARVSTRMWVHGLLCLALALTFHDNTGALLASLLLYVIFYIAHYRTLWKARKAPPPGTSLGFPDRRAPTISSEEDDDDGSRSMNRAQQP